ncbi:GDYXXLXY domain-containing protein [Flexithrix dorotheae]|uniref:GDYXXLXY domain-containing protein n=1 Tax=Flexithrix dorotheae TaxID=70993 RepID=UPI000374C1E2|nr:GDYXXLXY domain-containing protein [Flexithrix dorotheae]
MSYKKIFFLFNLLILIGIVNYEIFKKERILEEGKLVLFELAPVDPRSLMQGDYMRLRYAITRNYTPKEIPSRGYMLVSVNAEGVADRVVQVDEHLIPNNENEAVIKYFHNSWFVSIGSEAYFFEEGKAEKFEEAVYGGLKISPSGESLLVGLFDEQKNFIEP